MVTTAVSPPLPSPSPGEPESAAQAVQRVEQLIRQFFRSYQINRRWYQFSSTMQLLLAALIPVYAVVTAADSLNYKIVAASSASDYPMNSLPRARCTCRVRTAVLCRLAPAAPNFDRCRTTLERP